MLLREMSRAACLFSCQSVYVAGLPTYVQPRRAALQCWWYRSDDYGYTLLPWVQDRRQRTVSTPRRARARSSLRSVVAPRRGVSAVDLALQPASPFPAAHHSALAALACTNPRAWERTSLSRRPRASRRASYGRATRARARVCG
ncbi:hypothetical protein GY45DRAFT_40283 [Cubamyces sp. BRFM 1775]|nr:hypothetical protein GY45DRAFT_40283 [Cubamyces sp. BRFM 1775]